MQNNDASVMSAAGLVSNGYAVCPPGSRLPRLPDDCTRRCLQNLSDFHKLLAVSRTWNQLTNDTERDVVVEAREGEKFPRGLRLLERLAFPIKWRITVLRLRDCQLYFQGGSILATFLRGNTTLRELDVSKNFLRENGGKVLYDALRNNTTLESLNISRNRIGDDAGRDFAQLLRTNVALKSLDIGYNGLTDPVIIQFAARLHAQMGNNTTLTSLAIGGHGLWNGGASALANALRHNTALTRLDLRNSFLTHRDVWSLIDALDDKTTPLELDLCGWDEPYL